MVDVEGGNNLLYLPLDKLMGSGDQSRVMNTPIQFTAPAPVATQPKPQRRLRESLRNRGAR